MKYLEKLGAIGLVVIGGSVVLILASASIHMVINIWTNILGLL